MPAPGAGVVATEVVGPREGAVEREERRGPRRADGMGTERREDVRDDLPLGEEVDVVGPVRHRRVRVERDQEPPFREERRRRGRRCRSWVGRESIEVSPRAALPSVDDLPRGRIVPGRAYERSRILPPQAHPAVRLSQGSRRQARPVRRLGDARPVLRPRRRARRRPDEGRPLRRLAHGRDPREGPEGVRGGPEDHLQRRRGPRRRPHPVLGLPDRARDVRRRPPDVPARRRRLPPRRQRLEHPEGRRLGEVVRGGRAPRSRTSRPAGARSPSRGRWRQEILQPFVEADLATVAYYWFTWADVLGTPLHRLAHRLHRRGRLRGLRPRGRRAEDLERPDRGRHARRGSSRPASARATRSASRRSSRSTATTSTTPSRPWEADLGWIVKMKKGDFVGRDALAKQKEQGLDEEARGLLRRGTRHRPPRLPPEGRGIRRARRRHLRHPDADRRQGPRPRLRPARGHGRSGTRLLVDVRGKDVPAVVVPTPFYKRATA